MKQKPTKGIIVIGILLFLRSLWLFTLIRYYARFELYIFAIPSALNALAILYLTASVGIVNLKNWARLFSVTLLILNVALWGFISFLSLSQAIDVISIAHLLALVFGVVLIYYLTRPKIEELFT